MAFSSLSTLVHRWGCTDAHARCAGWIPSALLLRWQLSRLPPLLRCRACACAAQALLGAAKGEGSQAVRRGYAQAVAAVAKCASEAGLARLVGDAVRMYAEPGEGRLGPAKPLLFTVTSGSYEHLQAPDGKVSAST